MKARTLLSEFEFSLAPFQYQTCVLIVTPTESFSRTSKPRSRSLVQESILVVFCKHPRAALPVGLIQIRSLAIQT